MPRHFAMPCVHRLYLLVFIATVGVLVATPPAMAAWENDDWVQVFEANDYGEDLHACVDGQGGMIVALYDVTAGNTIRLNRIGHTGSELWGDGGVALPFDLEAEYQAGPVDVAPDGNGGAYVCYRQYYTASTQHILMVAHIENDGSYDWAIAVADFGMVDVNNTIDARIAPTGDGDAIVVWTQTTPTATAMAARIDSEISVEWLTTLDPGIHIPLWPGTPVLDLTSDHNGGVLVAYHYIPFMAPSVIHVQRLSGTGNKLWGTNGYIQSGIFHSANLVPDGAGGVYFYDSDVNNDVWAQHLNASGNETWGTTGMRIMDFPQPRSITNDGFCVDGSGGFFLVLGGADIYGQHVDINGNLLWGNTPLQLTSQIAYQHHPAAIPDGAGGVIVAYINDYYAAGTPPVGQLPGGIRVGALGATIWDKPDLWWESWGDNMEPIDMGIIPEGSHGALLYWPESSSGSIHEVYAMGVNAQGEVPKASLSVMFPEALPPEGTHTVEILGDYFDTETSFDLFTANRTTLPITDLSLENYNLVLGQVDLSGADEGGYHLQASSGGAAMDTLDYALGVGSPPECAEDEVFPGGDYLPVQPATSLRGAAFDQDGNVHVVWVEYDNDSSAYRLYINRGGAGGWATPWDYVFSAYNMHDPAITVGPDGHIHVAYIADALTSQELNYLHLDPDGGLVDADSYLDSQDEHKPTITVTHDNTVHIVYGAGDWGSTTLQHVIHDGNDFGTPVPTGAGTNSREPDMIAFSPEEIVLVFVRNSWFPGLSEVCYQYLLTDTWTEPVMMYFGVFVWSPHVGWDGGEKFMFTWILDNLGTAPLLHTCLLQEDELQPVRWRPGEPSVLLTSVAGVQPNLFYVLTEENMGGLPMNIYLRGSDGSALFPKIRLNVNADVDFPAFAAQRYGTGLFAFWQDFTNPDEPQHMWACFSIPDAVDDLPELATLSGPVASPNPFNPSTTLKFSIPRAGPVKLTIHDVRGRHLRTLLADSRPAGEQTARWDGRDDDGRSVASGVYFVRLQYGEEVMARKVLLAK